MRSLRHFTELCIKPFIRLDRDEPLLSLDDLRLAQQQPIRVVYPKFEKIMAARIFALAFLLLTLQPVMPRSIRKPSAQPVLDRSLVPKKTRFRSGGVFPSPNHRSGPCAGARPLRPYLGRKPSPHLRMPQRVFNAVFSKAITMTPLAARKTACILISGRQRKRLLIKPYRSWFGFTAALTRWVRLQPTTPVISLASSP